MNILMTHNPTHIYHNQKGSPENPERIEDVYRYIEKNLGNKIKTMDIKEPASMEDILNVHTQSYIEFIDRMSRKGATYLGDSTYLNRYSYMAALIAAESSIIAGDEVFDMNYDFAYALIRPPGHHASSDMYGGFCLLNNAAIVARHIMDRGMKKIAIIDWDAHAANGTMKIFYSSPYVLLLSIHRDPIDFYPHEGFMHQIGRGEGTGFTINIPVPAGTGDKEYGMLFEEIIDPVIKDYNPDFIIGENGFDPHYSHKNIGLALTIRGFIDIMKRIRRYRKPFMMIQEGGYTNFNKKIGYAMLKFLLTGEISEEEDILDRRIVQAKKVRKEVEDIIKRLKFIFEDYYNLR